MRTFRRLLLLRIGPSLWEFWLALAVFLWGVLGGLGSLNPAYNTWGMVSPIVALALALDGVRVWHLLSIRGRIAVALLVLITADMAWNTLVEVGHILSSAAD